MSDLVHLAAGGYASASATDRGGVRLALSPAPSLGPVSVTVSTIITPDEARALANQLLLAAGG